MDLTRIIKGLAGVFVLLGLALAGYGGYGVAESVSIAATAERQAEATLKDYAEGAHESRVTVIGRPGTVAVSALVHYAEIEWRGRVHTDPALQFLRWHKPGDRVPVYVSGGPHAWVRLADWPSRYFSYCVIIGLGLVFIGLPWVFLRSMRGAEREATLARSINPDATGPYHLPEQVAQRLTRPILGPLSPLRLIKGMLALLVFGTLAGLWAEYGPELQFGAEGEMLDALEQGDRAKALSLAQSGKGINAVDAYDQTPLIIALDRQDDELAAALIEAGARLDVQSKMLHTPLFLAVFHDKTELAERLLARGAPPDDARDALFHAINKRHAVRLVEAFVAAGADLGRRVEGLTPADLAALGGKKRVLALIEDAGGPTTLPAPCLWVARNDQGRVQEAIAEGADLDVNCYQRTLLGLARKLKRRAIVRLLERAPGGAPATREQPLDLPARR